MIHILLKEGSGIKPGTVHHLRDHEFCPGARLGDLIAEAIRGHWRMEALHWIRDVSFGEDLAQIRTGKGPR
jgi:hypothetical protein